MTKSNYYEEDNAEGRTTTATTGRGELKKRKSTMTKNMIV